MPRPGSGSIGHAKHHVAFGKSTYGPRARMKRQIDLLHEDEEKSKSKKPTEVFGSVEELFEKKSRKRKKP